MRNPIRAFFAVGLAAAMLSGVTDAERRQAPATGAKPVLAAPKPREPRPAIARPTAVAPRLAVPVAEKPRPGPHVAARPAPPPPPRGAAGDFLGGGAPLPGKKCGSNGNTIYANACTKGFQQACANGFTCHDLVGGNDGCTYGECKD